ncbi:MAG: hypothetical protein EOP09_11245 [Proteobacteria bacterium]|nr:MAG: hypothetical protein EOP09_11245 [Pseudomonadota bacterium]
MAKTKFVSVRIALQLIIRLNADVTSCRALFISRIGVSHPAVTAHADVEINRCIIGRALEINRFGNFLKIKIVASSDGGSCDRITEIGERSGETFGLARFGERR